MKTTDCDIHADKIEYTYSRLDSKVMDECIESVRVHVHHVSIGCSEECDLYRGITVVW